jgi:hypothetical protein
MRRPHIYSPFSMDKLPGSYRVPPRVTHEDIVGAVKGRFADHYLAAGYRLQLEARAVQQSDHRTLGR